MACVMLTAEIQFLSLRTFLGWRGGGVAGNREAIVGTFPLYGWLD
jgi:hypothetical protein